MALLFSGDLLVLLGAALAALLVLYHRTFDHFKKMGVPYEKPIPIFGNTLQMALRRKTFTTVLEPLYNKFKGSHYFGIFNFRSPVLVVCELDLVKQVLTKDFATFHDRGFPYDEKGDPLTAHLFNLSGKKWRNLRNKLTPTFTSGKLKMMYPLMVDVAKQLNLTIRSKIKKDKNVEFRDLIANYSVDLIGTCAFGITCNSLNGDNEEFLKMSRHAIEPSFLQLIRFLLSTIHYKLARLVPVKMIMPKVSTFFIDLMKSTVEYREKNKIVRNDFVNLMMQIRDEDAKKTTDKENFIEFTHSIMTAQALIFFVAGLDNVSNSVSWALHELALNPELQESAAKEVRETIANHEGKMSYEALQQMGLVDRILDEALRKYTPGVVLFRKTNSKTTLGSSGLVIEKDQMVFIPVHAIHHDPNLYPDPERFDPDRFTQEAKQGRHPYAYLPFGGGPRVCIAERFAMLEVKLCLVSLLNEFKFSVGPKTEVKPILDMKSFAPTAKNGIWLSVDERGEK